MIDNLYTTCGYHPTRCNELNLTNEDEVREKMLELCRKNSKKIVAIGEFGLDYERTQFCDVEQQKRYFEFQLKHLLCLNKPLFLHNRMSSQDLADILSKYRDENIKGGVVRIDERKSIKIRFEFRFIRSMEPSMKLDDLLN